MNASDSFHMRLVPHTGTRGYDEHEPRHVGRVEGLTHDRRVILRFPPEHTNPRAPGSRGIKAYVPLRRFRKEENSDA